MTAAGHKFVVMFTWNGTPWLLRAALSLRGTIQSLKLDITRPSRDTRAVSQTIALIDALLRLTHMSPTELRDLFGAPLITHPTLFDVVLAALVDEEAANGTVWREVQRLEKSHTAQTIL